MLSTFSVPSSEELEKNFTFFMLFSRLYHDLLHESLLRSEEHEKKFYFFSCFSLACTTIWDNSVFVLQINNNLIST